MLNSKSIVPVQQMWWPQTKTYYISYEWPSIGLANRQFSYLDTQSLPSVLENRPDQPIITILEPIFRGPRLQATIFGSFLVGVCQHFSFYINNLAETRVIMKYSIVIFISVGNLTTDSSLRHIIVLSI